MPKLTYAENPVHPVLNDYPSALVPASLVFDMLHLVTRRPTFRNASFFSLLLALVTGIPAAVAGYRDYLEIPEGTEMKRIANVHAVLNVGLLGALGLGLVLRMFGHISFFARFLNLSANGALLVSGWYGTHLVYRHGMRVHGVDPIADAPEMMPDTGAPYAESLVSFAQGVPAGDLRTLVNQAGGFAAQATQTATQVGQQAQTSLQDAAQALQARAEEVRGKAEGSEGSSDEMAASEGTAASGADSGPLLDVAATSRMSLEDASGSAGETDR